MGQQTQRGGYLSLVAITQLSKIVNDGLIDMLCEVLGSFTAIVPNQEVLHRNAFTGLETKRTTTTIEHTMDFKFIQHTTAFAKQPIRSVWVGVVHVHPYGVAFTQTTLSVWI